MDPVSEARSLAAIQVRVVHVTSGWTALEKDLGRLAPKTNEERVTNRRNEDRRGVIHWEVGDFLTRATVEVPAIHAHAWSVKSKVLENALGGWLVTGIVEATTVNLSESGLDLESLFPPVSFRTPRTDQAVVKRVKKNPPIMTEKILSK